MTNQIIDPGAVFDTREFRRALGSFATGVTVMTATAPNGKRVGVTANSFNSVSLDPPLILWSIDKRSASHAVFEAATHFAVNVLAVDQMALSNQFARASDDKFANVNLHTGQGGCLLLDGTAAAFECEKYQMLDGGDHWILIGKVLAFADHGRAPLLYHQGSYSVVLPHPSLERVNSSAQRVRSGFQKRLSRNLYYLMTQAVQCYQKSYVPRQLETGWRPLEARLLMILDADEDARMGELVREAASPRREVEQSLGLLKSKHLVAQSDDRYKLTANGVKKAQAVWAMAASHQETMFAQFSDSQMQAFKTVLEGLVAASAQS